MDESWEILMLVQMQFVNFTEIMSRPIPTSKKEAEFALSALMEIPAQFKAAMNLQLLGYYTLITLKILLIETPSILQQ